MKWLNGLLVLLLFQCLGELLKWSLDLLLPGPVIGLLLLFVFLCLQGRVSEPLQQTAQGLIQHLGLLFLPAATGVFFLNGLSLQQWLAIAVAVVVGSVLSLLFNGLVIRWLTGTEPGAEQSGDHLP